MNRNHSKISHAIEPATNSTQRLVYSKLIIRRGFFISFRCKGKMFRCNFFVSCVIVSHMHVHLNRIYASSQSESELNPKKKKVDGFRFPISPFLKPLMGEKKRAIDRRGGNSVKMWKCQMS